MKYCIHCGQPLPDDARYCNYCGREVVDEVCEEYFEEPLGDEYFEECYEEPLEENKKVKDPFIFHKVWIIVGIILNPVLRFGYISLFFFMLNGDPNLSVPLAIGIACFSFAICLTFGSYAIHFLSKLESKKNLQGMGIGILLVVNVIAGILMVTINDQKIEENKKYIAYKQAKKQSAK